MSFRNKEINRKAVRGATTREEFILSIRGGDLLGNLEDAPDNKINLWVNLLGSWPTITTGGPRYILQVRYHFLHQIDVINNQGITWDGKSSIKVPNEDETTYILFGISKGRLTRANWNALLISNPLGLVRLEAIQSKSLNFNPAATSDYRTIVDLCKTCQLSQRGAVLEWARGNPEEIPEFILQMKRTLSFRGWFKPYYDGLRLMYKRLTTKDTPKIPDLDDALDTAFRFQSKIEIMKLEAIKIELQEYTARVEWFREAEAHADMLDRTRLLHRLPQLSSRKSGKRGRSRSNSGNRNKTRNPCSSPGQGEAMINIEAFPSNAPPVVNDDLPSSPALAVELVSPPDTNVVSGNDSDSGDTTISGDMFTEPRDSDDQTPRPVKVRVQHGDGAVPNVVFKKGGCRVVISYDDYLRQQFTQDSSDDEIFEIETPTELLDSLQA